VSEPAKRLLLIPAAGQSLRMGGLPKELFPIGSRLAPDGRTRIPVSALGQTVEAALLAGVNAVAIVTSSAKAPLLMDATAALDLAIPVAFVHQAQQAGLGAAVACAREQIVSSDVTLLLMPDTILRPLDAPRGALEAAESTGVAGVTLHRVERPELFGVALLEDGVLRGFVDKPESPPGDLVWTCCAFTPAFLPYLDRARGAGSEWGLTEALDLAAREGLVGAHVVEDGGYYDIGTYDGYVAALDRPLPAV
jgi:UTP-glucose-1-phosphate uridylyltransferase